MIVGWDWSALLRGVTHSFFRAAEGGVMCGSRCEPGPLTSVEWASARATKAYRSPPVMASTRPTHCAAPAGGRDPMSTLIPMAKHIGRVKILIPKTTNRKADELKVVVPEDF